MVITGAEPAICAGADLADVREGEFASATSTIGVPAAKLGLVINYWTVERLVRESSWPVARACLGEQ